MLSILKCHRQARHYQAHGTCALFATAIFCWGKRNVSGFTRQPYNVVTTGSGKVNVHFVFC